jgi:hypothetical protein
MHGRKTLRSGRFNPYGIELTLADYTNRLVLREFSLEGLTVIQTPAAIT